ncbi:copper chaperone PCu(A)C [Curvibacter sp. HBC61]|uniref:Copper chaperone PCu(A)C n=1 Tax=Curvibacter cyanobacteriorum TaxID=3026422 RepID=A0ABT5N654_9BURK|nr:copper chaperone PCu(A)C [Curvibacter sp. HBC61]MDD0841044.1 copper chaperone PCu(A)C [Curvibacter sp. HBC61]
MRQFSAVLGAALCALSFAVSAQGVDVKGAWARASVPGQKATGAFMTLTAPAGATLVGVRSPAAGVTELHEMKMDGDVMKMRAVPSLPLPAGQAVELKPGGYHVMLLDLKAPLAKDSTVPITLLLRDAKGVDSQLELKVPVKAVAPSGATGGHAH